MKKRRYGIVVAVVVVAALVAAYFIADAALRQSAEARVAKQISEQLPKTVSAHPNVTIGGFSVIAQYLSGSFERVSLDAPHTTVNDVPLDVHVVARGVPTDRSKPVDEMGGTVQLTQDAVNRLIDIPGATGEVKLGDGEIGYQATGSTLGIDFGYAVAASAKAAGSTILLTPKTVKLSAGSSSIDLSKLLGSVTQQPVPICVAKYLPSGVTVTGVSLTAKKATVTLASHSLALSSRAFKATGTCN